MTDTGSPASAPASAPGPDDRARRLAVRGLFVVALAIAAGFGVTRLLPASGSSAGSSGVPTTLTICAPAPALSGQTLYVTTLSLADLRGKPVIVNFWASWCAPCKGEFPAFKSVLANHTADGLQIVGVLFNDGAVPARAFVAQEGATWPTVLDPSGGAAKTFEVFGAPESFLIDRSGIVRSRILGGLTQSSLEQALAPILR